MIEQSRVQLKLKFTIREIIIIQINLNKQDYVLNE